MKNFLAQVDIGQELFLRPGKAISDIGTLGNLISAILPNVYVLAGLIFFFLLIGGGITVIVSAGQENPEGAAKGKKAITAALTGFLIIFCSYWLIQIVETIAGIDILGGGGL